ncbi:MAG TPA: LamG domain-containing protein [Sedimentisphaerales bacterium]|nr:LamG domain-containing protein [Sedimentisphaerales bacterium]
MDKKMFCLSLVVLLFGSILSLPLTARIEAADKNKPKTLDTDPNLAGWWKFDEASGKTTPDSSKHGRNGTLKEELSFEDSTQGRTGKALKFDDNGYVEITKYKGVTGTRPRTVAAWIKTKNTRGEIISWGTDDFGKMFTFCFVRGRIGIRPNGGYYYMNDPTNDDKWHHVAVVVKEAEMPNLHDDVVLYKDGTIAEIHDIGLLDLWPIDTGSDLDVRIGRGFEGLIDDVRIYDRVLSDEEIMALFKLQSDRPLPKPEK